MDPSLSSVDNRYCDFVLDFHFVIESLLESAQETRQYWVWDHDAEDQTEDLVTSELFKAADRSDLDEELPLGKVRKSEGKAAAQKRKKDKKKEEKLKKKKKKAKKSKKAKSTSSSAASSVSVSSLTSDGSASGSRSNQVGSVFKVSVFVISFFRLFRFDFEDNQRGSGATEAQKEAEKKKKEKQEAAEKKKAERKTAAEARKQAQKEEVEKKRKQEKEAREEEKRAKKEALAEQRKKEKEVTDGFRKVVRKANQAMQNMLGRHVRRLLPSWAT